VNLTISIRYRVQDVSRSGLAAAIGVGWLGEELISNLKKESG
jgi:hypothetical protein